MGCKVSKPSPHDSQAIVMTKLNLFLDTKPWKGLSPSKSQEANNFFFRIYDLLFYQCISDVLIVGLAYQGKVLCLDSL